MAIGTEVLFGGTNADGDPEIFSYDASLVNSGTRGFGAYVYNSLESDDSIVTDATAIANTVEFVGRNRTLVVSDWAYDLVEAGWPDAITFVDEELGLDSAAVDLDESVIADVVDPDLAEVLLNDQLQIDFAFSYWTSLNRYPRTWTYIFEGMWSIDCRTTRVQRCSKMRRCWWLSIQDVDASSIRPSHGKPNLNP